MKYEEICKFRRCEYSQECENCGIWHTILTQRDNHSEYDTDIYLKCDCGDYVEFILPVN
jgi:hypothetical protein